MATETKKNTYMDIDSLIDKVSKLPIPDTEKANLLRQFKENMMHPDRGEIENLNRIQSKYSNIYPGITPSQISSDFLPSINPNLPNQLNLSQMPMSSMAMMMPQQQIPQQPQQQGLTVAHFEVLKNKMDSIQLELVDLLRHVKDYTQRYMNATRQQDMEKIDAYINGLFEVDKQMKRAEEQAAVMATEDEAEEAAAGPEKSTITRATDGIKNFLGSIGDGVSGITSFVSSTANIVNDTLSKKVLGGTTNTTPNTTSSTTPNTTSNTTALTNTTTPSMPSTPVANNTNTKVIASKSNNNTSPRGNIVNVNDYIQSNMNQFENASPAIPTSRTTANLNNSSNNITSSNNINAMAQNNKANNVDSNVESKAAPKTESNAEPKAETAEGNQEEITAAINQLNDTMNADINNTVSQGQQLMNTKSQSGGSRQEKHLTKKIQMLRLQLTKQKLEKQLLYKDGNRNSKTKNKITNKKNGSRTKKHLTN